MSAPIPARAGEGEPQVRQAIRLGMLTPSSNTVLEPVCAAMARDLPGVSLHVSRFRVTEISLEHGALDQFSDEPMLAAADLLADARVGSICWNGTSGAWLGLGRDRALCAAIARRTGIPATSSVLSLLDILGRRGLRRIGLVTPYRDDVQRKIVATLAAEGLSVVAERHGGLRENFAFAAVTATELIGMVESVAEARPEAIAVLCTNLRAALLVEELEARLGVAVLDSVAAALCGALTLAGAAPRLTARWGRLFRDASRIGSSEPAGGQDARSPR